MDKLQEIHTCFHETLFKMSKNNIDLIEQYVGNVENFTGKYKINLNQCLEKSTNLG